MKHLIKTIFGNIARRGWLAGIVTIGLVATAWVTIAHFPSDKNLAGDGKLRAAAADSNQSSDVERTMCSLDEAIVFAHARRETLCHLADYAKDPPAILRSSLMSKPASRNACLVILRAGLLVSINYKGTAP